MTPARCRPPTSTTDSGPTEPPIVFSASRRRAAGGIYQKRRMSAMAPCRLRDTGGGRPAASRGALWRPVRMSSYAALPGMCLDVLQPAAPNFVPILS